MKPSRPRSLTCRRSNTTRLGEWITGSSSSGINYLSAGILRSQALLIARKKAGKSAGTLARSRRPRSSGDQIVEKERPRVARGLD